MSLDQPTLKDHQKTRQKYVNLAWTLWREQAQQNFFVWHPLPEEHLAIELSLYWRDQIASVHGWNDILGQIVKPIKDAINSIISWFWKNVIQPGIAALISGVKWVVDGILSVVGSIQEGVAGLGAKLIEGVNWIWKQFEGFFSAVGEVLKQIGMWVINAVKTYVVDPLLAGLGAVFDALKGLVSSIWNFITGGIMAHSPQEWRGSYTRWLGIIIGVSGMALTGFVGAALADIVHPFKDTRIKEVAEFALRFSGIAYLQAAFFTTFFDIATAKPVRQELNSIFTPEVPGAGDLIRFVVREVIAPTEFTVAMAMQGFSKYWADAYWEAHWVLPPAERTRTAFLRKKIPEEAYRKFLVWYDFKPDPRPGIPISDVDLMLATQYDWPGRIDTRWLLEWGEVSLDEATDLIKAGGMDPEWAPRLAKVYLLNQIRDEYNRVRSVLMEMSREGFLGERELTEALKDLNFAKHTIEATLKWARLSQQWDDIKEQASAWWSLAKARKITPEQYGNEMRRLGMTEARITSKMNLLRRLAEIEEAAKPAK